MAEQINEAVAGPAISLVDLQNAIKIIDYACEQGAFKGWTVIEQVRIVRAKLAEFVDASTPAEEVATEGNSTEATTTEGK